LREVGEWRNRLQVLPNSRYGGRCVDKSIGKGAASKPYDVDVRNIDNGVVDIRNNVVDKCCKESKT
jgi:hypothetical protein